MILKEALLQGQRLLEDAGVTSPRLTAEVLLAHAASQNREWLYAHLDARSHPFNAIAIEQARAVVDTLPGLEPELWAGAWLSAARQFESQAAAAELEGRTSDAREAWWQG